MHDEEDKTRANAAGALGNLVRNSGLLCSHLIEAHALQVRGKSWSHGPLLTPRVEAWVPPRHQSCIGNNIQKQNLGCLCCSAPTHLHMQYCTSCGRVSTAPSHHKSVSVVLLLAGALGGAQSAQHAPRCSSSSSRCRLPAEDLAVQSGQHVCAQIMCRCIATARNHRIALKAFYIARCDCQEVY